MSFEGMPEDTGSMAATADLMNDPEAVDAVDAAVAEASAVDPNDPWRAKQDLILSLFPAVVENQRRLLLAAEEAASSDLKKAAELRQLAGAWGRLGGGF